MAHILFDLLSTFGLVVLAVLPCFFEALFENMSGLEFISSRAIAVIAASVMHQFCFTLEEMKLREIHRYLFCAVSDS